MKKFITCILLLAICHASFSQNIEHRNILTKQDYLKKSRKQRTIDWILMGTGVALVTVGVIATSEAETFIDEQFSTGALISVIGLAPMVVGTVFLIDAGNNKRKAARLTANFDIRHTPVVRQYALARIPTPSMSLRLNL